MLFADKVKQFKKSDHPRFQKFIRKSFHNKYILSDFKFFHWQFKGKKNSVYNFFLLQDGARLFGNIGLAALDYQVFKKTINIKTYINLFVDPAVRSLGLGTLLIKKAMAQGKTALITGYNPKSFSIYRQLGDWRPLGNFYRYVFIFNKKSVLRMLPKTKIKKRFKFVDSTDKPHLSDPGIEFKYIKKFDSQFDKFWRAIMSKYGITATRSSNYLNWRYANHPYLKYFLLVACQKNEIIGFLIYRLEKTDEFTIARVIDFICGDEHEKDILNGFILDVRQKGVDMVDFMFSGRYYHESLKAQGFFNAYGTPFENLPMYFNPISYSKNYINFAAWSANKNINKREFYKSGNWYLTKGDADQDRPNPH